MNIGEQLSHYRIVGKLGEGGMGVVYRAEDVRLGRPVALKVLAPQLAGDAVARRRFEAEARAASALDHPNICALYDVGETPDGRLFLALAYCEGETLRSGARRAGRSSRRERSRSPPQVADGLAEAHAKGIVHRDIKPANLMLRPDGLVKILDFGVAKLERDAGITGPTDSVGSPAYMAPEQIQSARVGPAADVWSLGVVLFEMLDRPAAVRGRGDPAPCFASILNDAPPALDALRPGVHPASRRQCVARALAKDPESRYPTARANSPRRCAAVERRQRDRTRDPALLAAGDDARPRGVQPAPESPASPCSRSPT